MKRLILLLIFLGLINLTYSTDICYNKPDSYILKCNFKQDLFLKEFTCLDSNCSDKIYKYDDSNFILQSNNKSITLFKNQIVLDSISKPEILRSICEEKIPDTLLAFVKRINGKEVYSGENLIIEKFTNENYERALGRVQSLECYDENVEISDGWIFESRYLKDYCNIDKKDLCVVVSKSYLGLISNGFSNLGTSILTNVFSFILGIGIALGIIGFIIHIFENKKVDVFFKITSRKIIISVIILIPLVFFTGKIANLLFFTELFRFYFLKEVFIIIDVFLVYIISCIIMYYVTEFKK